MSITDELSFTGSKSDQQIFDTIYAENNSVLRGEVRAALKKRGIHKINPLHLEFALKYGHDEYNIPAPWFEKKHRLHVRLRQTLRDMANAPAKDWPNYVSDIINRILNRRYSAPHLSEYGLQQQPHRSRGFCTCDLFHDQLHILNAGSGGLGIFRYSFL